MSDNIYDYTKDRSVRNKFMKKYKKLSDDFGFSNYNKQTQYELMFSMIETALEFGYFAKLEKYNQKLVNGSL